MAQLETIEAKPAYGADYTSAAKVREAWEAGKDWQDGYSGQYLNKQDIERERAAGANISVMLRYAKLQKVIVV